MTLGTALWHCLWVLILDMTIIVYCERGDYAVVVPTSIGLCWVLTALARCPKTMGIHVQHTCIYFSFYKCLLINYLLGTVLASVKHILDMLGCSMLNKHLSIDLIQAPFQKNLLMPQFGQWFISSCFPGSSWLDCEA